MNKIARQQFAKWKIAIITILGVLIFLRIGYIIIGDEIDKDYKIAYDYDLSDTKEVSCQHIEDSFIAEHNRLDSIELILCGINDNEPGTVTLSINHGDKILYKTNISLINLINNEWNRVFVNAPLIKGNEYVVILDANEDCLQIPNVLYGSRSGGSINLVINYRFYKSSSIMDRVVMSSLWVIVLAVLCILVKNIEIIKGYCLVIKKYVYNSEWNNMILKSLFEVVVCFILLNCSGIEFEEMTKAIFYLISIIAVTNYEKKKKLIERTINGNLWRKILIWVLYLYASFALVGQRMLVYPLGSMITIHKAFVLVCATLWFIPVVNSFVFYLDLASRKFFLQTSKTKTWQFIVINVLILLLPLVFSLYAFNPGISSWDTMDVMVTNAQNIVGMYDWHPAFYCMLIRVIENIWNSTYAVIIFQYVLWLYVMLELLLFLRGKGLSEIVIYISACFCGLNAANMIHINTIWKDIPYTLSLLWLFVLVAKISIDYEKYKNKWYVYIEMVFALVGVFFYRKNGVVPFIIVSVALAIWFYKNKKLMLSLLASIIIIAVIKGPVYNHFQIEDPGVRGMYHGLGQDILGVYYSGGEVSEDTLQIINMMTSYNNAEYSYNPTWSNQSYDVYVEPRTFIFTYLDTFIKNPILMCRAVIDRVDAMWDIFQGEDTELGYVNYIGTMDGPYIWNDYYSERVYTSLLPRMSAATSYTAKTQWISVIEWRAGLFSLLGFICIIWLIIRCGRGRYIIICAPIAGHILSLLLSTGWSDFRYFWPLNLLNFSLIFMTLVILRQKWKGGETNIE